VAQLKFGTDGWRAVIAEDFTFENVAQAACGFEGLNRAAAKVMRLREGRFWP
jgi:phosphomannomutase